MDGAEPAERTCETVREDGISRLQPADGSGQGAWRDVGICGPSQHTKRWASLLVARTRRGVERSDHQARQRDGLSRGYQEGTPLGHIHQRIQGNSLVGLGM